MTYARYGRHQRIFRPSDLQTYTAKADSCDAANALILGLRKMVIFSPAIPEEEGLREIEGGEYLQFQTTSQHVALTEHV